MGRSTSSGDHQMGKIGENDDQPLNQWRKDDRYDWVQERDCPYFQAPDDLRLADPRT